MRALSARLLLAVTRLLEAWDTARSAGQFVHREPVVPASAPTPQVPGARAEAGVVIDRSPAHRLP